MDVTTFPQGEDVALHSCDCLFKVCQENVSQVFGRISVYTIKNKNTNHQTDLTLQMHNPLQVGPSSLL